MLKNEICGYMLLLYSVADKPLELWSKHISHGGKVRRMRDDQLHGDRIIEITEPHNNTISTSITIPAKMLDVLNIKLPILVLIIKNLNLRFKLIVDKKQYRRRFVFMTHNVEKLPNINANVACIPLRLEESWNFLEINLQTLCHEAYGTDYEALQRIMIYPNCHLRRVYLQDRHYNDDEIPPDKMRQAFLDMYMLKRGINFIENACQTEECYTGSLKQIDSNCSAKDNSISAPSRKMDLHKTVGCTEKLKNSNHCMDLNLHNSSILKRNHMSMDALNNAIKPRNQNVFTRRSEWFTKSLINDPVVENKSEKNSSEVTKNEERFAVKTYKTGNSLLNIKINNTSRPISSIELEKIAKSQFLKTHVNEILFEDDKLAKCSQEIQNAGDTHINLKNYTLNCISNTNNVQIGKNNSTGAKFKTSAVSYPSTFSLSENIKPDKISNNVSNTLSDAYVISKYKYIKESEKNITNRLKSLVNIEENTEDIFKRI
ncbi:uncharacterized protein LOC105208012 isoform X2 [Solenopsis invicta]|uniref:uncharacterized protein LOC105208012 isoform X2 n=1 Tax=Solenopsis invicta TaxID=13686 RepID=UPI00193E9687|nr:uncharacterized protein LOC105208012 isoform X2 [Solenopsis invicta]